ncbi:hypothetical protein ACFXDJ_05180 [Streptomyces sp. NPDC059443]|uniref:hypothetical protein n=1 Tax=unclassified Streptomyces TaxID=2593676 RepID=UPI0036BC7A64
MNDPITLAATEYEEPRGLPDTTEIWPPPAECAEYAEPDEDTAASEPAPHLEADPGPGDRDAPREGSGSTSALTVLEAAATGRPVSEVTALVSLLNDSGQHPNPGHAALRAAAVARPVHEVREMVTLLGEPPHENVEADITLKAAALGRPIEDVALLVSILGTGEQAPYRPAESGPRDPGAPDDPRDPGRTAVHRPPAPVPVPPRVPPGPRPPARPAGGALRHVLRWPVALALLVCGALHVPADPAGLFSGDPGGPVALAVTLLCLTAGALLAVRDTAWAWRAGAVIAMAVTALHVVGGAVEFDPLAGAVGASVSWAGVTAVLSAATGAVLAGLALQYRPAAGPVDDA